ncbi:MAG: hypothetical protein KGL59_11110, partial [Acidobacteriota bacterium]|nr:hypothetical protein [Acidobacteriota bacterium]
MGFFAILRSQGQANPPQIVACHLNLWVLTGLLGRRIFAWDVGLRIKPEGAHAQCFRIALPACAEAYGYEDLSSLMSEPKVAELIFGRPVTYPEKNTICLGKESFTISAVPSANVKVDEKRSGPDFTIWE